MNNQFSCYAPFNCNYAYAIVNHTVGEVYGYGSNSHSILKKAIRRFYSILRDAEEGGYSVKISLVNTISGETLLEGEYEVPELVAMMGCKNEAEMWEVLDEIHQEVFGWSIRGE